jgi:nucleotide-binding universal stress UspA family protein
MEIRKILIPVDGSAYMINEIECACTLANKFGAEVSIVHVVAIPVTSELSGIPAASEQLEEAGNQILHEALSMAEDCGLKPTIKMDFSVGNPGMRIVKMAEESGADLIIIGAKGKSRIRELLMGSVANTVVNGARCLVLVVHGCEDP